MQKLSQDLHTSRIGLIIATSPSDVVNDKRNRRGTCHHEGDDSDYLAAG